MKSDKHLPHIILLEDNLNNKLIFPQINTKYSHSSPFSPKKFHKLKTQQKIKVDNNKINFHSQELIQSKRSNLNKVAVFQLNQMMSSQPYLSVFKKLQQSHKYRQKALLDKTLSSKILRQLFKKLQNQSQSSNHKQSNKKNINQKIKTQQKNKQIYNIGLNKDPNIQKQIDYYLHSNSNSVPKIRIKKDLTLKNLVEEKFQRSKKDYDYVKSLRNPFIINQKNNRQEIGQINLEQQTKLSLNERQSKQIIKQKHLKQNKKKKQRMSMETTQRQRNDIKQMIINQKDKRHISMNKIFLNSEIKQKIITQQNDKIEGWGANNSEYFNSHYF